MKLQSNFANRQFAKVGKIVPSATSKRNRIQNSSIKSGILKDSLVSKL